MNVTDTGGVREDAMDREEREAEMLDQIAEGHLNANIEDEELYELLIKEDA
jgi:hypothetical protein